MERKIGEVFEHKGEWYQCVKGDICVDCDFVKKHCTKSPLLKVLGNCNYRKDATPVIFKKLEKVGEPYPNADKLYQLYKLPMNIEKLPPHTEGINLVRFDIVEIEIKQNKEDMEEKKQKLDDLVGLYSSAQMTYKEFDKELKALYTKHSNSEKFGKNLKEFNLEAAKAGKPVCTRDGRKARIICFDAKGDKPIIALVEMGTAETPNNYPIDGKAVSTKETSCDLMILPEKKEGWVNVYKRSIYKTKEDAFNRRIKEDYLMTIKVDWEE